MWGRLIGIDHELKIGDCPIKFAHEFRDLHSHQTPVEMCPGVARAKLHCPVQQLERLGAQLASFHEVIRPAGLDAAIQTKIRIGQRTVGKGIDRRLHCLRSLVNITRFPPVACLLNILIERLGRRRAD